MIEYECEYCGERIRALDELAGQLAQCPACGGYIVVPAGEDERRVDTEGDFADTSGTGELALYEDEEGTLSTGRGREGPTKKSSFLGWVALGGLPLGCLVFGGGGVALHIWTAYLFYHNWGAFWGIVAFFFPGISTLLACVMCFWWGVWFYILAPAAWVACACAAASLDEERTRGFTIVAAIVLIILLASFAYFVIDYATSPDHLSEVELRQADDMAAVVCGILVDSVSADPERLTKLPKVKAEMRRQLSDCSDEMLGEVRRGVDAYLRVLALVNTDVIN